MSHGAGLISTLAAGLGLAWVMGFVAVKLRLPPIAGYLLAGIIIGPATPGFVADVELTQQLAEVGIMLMMFGVGLHFSIDDLMAVRRIAIPGALVQIAVATALGAGTALFWGWNVGAALVFGLALSVASTVVLLRALEARGVLNSVNGRIAVGWLVVEDLVVVLILVLLPALATLGGTGGAAEIVGGSMVRSLAVALAKVAAFVVLMLVVGRRLFPSVLWEIARTGSRELFTLGVVSTAVGVAYLAASLFNVSFALGAFFAGMMLRGSSLSHRAAEESLPLRDAFSVLFFVSVGMLFEPSVLIREPLKVAAVVGVVIIGKTLAAILLVLAFRYPLNTALTVGASLAQIGEFSFILAGLGVTLGILPPEGNSLILAAALASISLNPLVFTAIEPAQAWIRARSSLARALELRDDPLAELPKSVDPRTVTGHVLLVGHGRVGRRISEILDRAGVVYVVADQDRETVVSLRARNVHAVIGDASDPAVLIQGHVARARVLIIAMPDLIKARQMVTVARTLNPGVKVLFRTHTDEETELLERENLGAVFMGERELGAAMASHVLEQIGQATPSTRSQPVGVR
jgi:CPA2 family monovalent cation:H+ antiporter-2